VLPGLQGGTPGAKRKAAQSLKSIMDTKDSALQKVLTPAQWTVYQKHAAALREAIKEKMQESK